MRVIYNDPRRLTAGEESELGLTWVPFDELLATADYVSLHAVLNEKTHHLIGARELKLMKSTAFLINTSRGPIVDEQALLYALTERRIGGAGLDVFENEPGIDPVLLGLPNTVITPHMGSAVETLRAAMADVVVDNILALLDGRQPPNCWNRKIYTTPNN
jgi:glyoxylate reductase